MKVFIHIPKTAGSSVRKAMMDSASYARWMQGHWTASQVKARGKMHGVENVDLFTVVRNPYDRFASTYFHVQNRRSRCRSQHTHFNKLSFDEFTHCFLEDWDSREMLDNFHHFLPQRAYFDTDTPIKIFRTEKLDDLEAYLKIGLTKQNVGTYQKPYDTLYTPELRRLVREFYHEDFEKFGY